MERTFLIGQIAKKADVNVETLKNQGYHFEHNFGHGYKNLSTVFAMLMMLAFLIDQTEQFCCGLFQGALEKLNSKKSRLWKRVKGFFEFHVVNSCVKEKIFKQ